MKDRRMADEEELLWYRRGNYCGYKFCPLCSTGLVEKMTDGRMRMVCRNDSCKFVFYQNPLPAAGAILIQNGKILLVKRAEPPRVGYWCIPAGFMEWNEHPSETAIREIKEETGLEISIDEFFEVFSSSDDPRSNSILMIYLATITGGTLQAGDDALEAKYFSLDNLPDQIAFKSHERAFKLYKERLGCCKK